MRYANKVDNKKAALEFVLRQHMRNGELRIIDNTLIIFNGERYRNFRLTDAKCIQDIHEYLDVYYKNVEYFNDDFIIVYFSSGHRKPIFGVFKTFEGSSGEGIDEKYPHLCVWDFSLVTDPVFNDLLTPYYKVNK